MMEKLIILKDFFGKPAHLTVSGQLNAETYAESFVMYIHLVQHLELKIQIL